MATTKVQTFPGDVEVTSNLAVNTNTLYVDAINEKVGINTVTPSSNLQVVGKVSISDDLTVGEYSNLVVDVSENRVRFDSSLNTYNLEIKPDKDITGIVGKARFGYIDNDVDCASFAHIDNTGTNQWALLCNSAGTTIINTRNRHEIRSGTAIKATITGTNLSTAKMAINTDSGASYAMHVYGLAKQDLPSGHGYYSDSKPLYPTIGERIQWDSGVIPNDDRNNIITFDDTNDGWVAPVSGLYEIMGTVTTYQQSTSSRGYDINVTVNEAFLERGAGTVFSVNGSRYRNTNTYAKHNFNYMVQLNANDRVNIFTENAEVTGIFYSTNMSVILINPD